MSQIHLLFLRFHSFLTESYPNLADHTLIYDLALVIWFSSFFVSQLILMKLWTQYLMTQTSTIPINGDSNNQILKFDFFRAHHVFYLGFKRWFHGSGKTWLNDEYETRVLVLFYGLYQWLYQILCKPRIVGELYFKLFSRGYRKWGNSLGDICL